MCVERKALRAGASLALAHALGSGTDASIPVVRYAMLASALPILFMFALRAQRGRERAGASRPEMRGAPRAEVGMTRAKVSGQMEPRPSQAS